MVVFLTPVCIFVVVVKKNNVHQLDRFWSPNPLCLTCLFPWKRRTFYPVFSITGAFLKAPVTISTHPAKSGLFWPKKLTFTYGAEFKKSSYTPQMVVLPTLVCIFVVLLKRTLCINSAIFDPPFPLCLICLYPWKRWTFSITGAFFNATVTNSTHPANSGLFWQK